LRNAKKHMSRIRWRRETILDVYNLALGAFFLAAKTWMPGTRPGMTNALTRRFAG
jgi:hypothetical protein